MFHVSQSKGKDKG